MTSISTPALCTITVLSACAGGSAFLAIGAATKTASLAYGILSVFCAGALYGSANNPGNANYLDTLPHEILSGVAKASSAAATLFAGAIAVGAALGLGIRTLTLLTDGLPIRLIVPVCV